MFFFSLSFFLFLSHQTVNAVHVYSTYARQVDIAIGRVRELFLAQLWFSLYFCKGDDQSTVMLMLQYNTFYICRKQNHFIFTSEKCPLEQGEGLF